MLDFDSYPLMSQIDPWVKKRAALTVCEMSARLAPDTAKATAISMLQALGLMPYVSVPRKKTSRG